MFSNSPHGFLHAANAYATIGQLCLLGLVPTSAAWLGCLLHHSQCHLRGRPCGVEYSYLFFMSKFPELLPHFSASQGTMLHHPIIYIPLREPGLKPQSTTYLSVQSAGGLVDHHQPDSLHFCPLATVFHAIVHPDDLSACLKGHYSPLSWLSPTGPIHVPGISWNGGSPFPVWAGFGLRGTFHRHCQREQCTSRVLIRVAVHPLEN